MFAIPSAKHRNIQSTPVLARVSVLAARIPSSGSDCVLHIAAHGPVCKFRIASNKLVITFVVAVVRRRSSWEN
jgi:hypothetical protein